MPYQKITLTPGINTQASQTLNEGGWSESNRIRWRDGYLEKLMGWTHLTSEPVVGVARTMWSFQDLDAIKYLAIGTNQRLQLYTQGALYDITPLRATHNVAVDFSTVSSSATVTIVDAGHGAAAGDEVNIVVPVAVGGLIIHGTYEIDTVVDANTYRITAASAATSTVNNGGAVPLFNTTNTSATVTVTLANHGLTITDDFEVEVSTIVGGVTLNGIYLVNTVPTANTFTILASSTASSTTSGSENGGNARFQYLISPGPVSDTALIGWGSGTYGSGYYGLSSMTAAISPARYWALDNFGENLLASPTNGPLYQWIPPLSSSPRATLVSNAPAAMTSLFVAMPQAQVVSLGAEVLGTQDPLLIRWSDNGDYSSSGSWTASSTNQAGSYRLSRGSRVVGGLQGPQAGLIWTDTDLWQMQYVGSPFVYSFSQIASSGLIAPWAMGMMGRDVYWMSLLGFYRYGQGAVQPIPCAVWDQIFNNIDRENADKVIAAPNTHVNEIAWYYPSTSGSGEIDSYVKFNIINGLWDYGELVRTAWADNNIFGLPLGMDANGIVQQHESGFNSDDEAMTGVFAESGYTDIADGTDFVFIDQIIPDLDLDGTSPAVQFTMYTTDYPGATPKSHGPYTISATTRQIATRARGRQVAFKIASDTIDTWWRLGATRIRTAPSGRR